MSSFMLNENGLLVQDGYAQQSEDCFTDHEGMYRRIPIFWLSNDTLALLLEEMHKDGDLFRTALHKRPGVEKEGVLLAMAWEHWERLRVAAWKLVVPDPEVADMYEKYGKRSTEGWDDEDHTA